MRTKLGLAMVLLTAATPACRRPVDAIPGGHAEEASGSAIPAPAVPPDSEVAQRLSVRVECDAATWDPHAPSDARLRIVVTNEGDRPVAVPGAYDGRSVVLFGQGGQQWPLTWSVEPFEPGVRELGAGDSVAILDMALSELLSDSRGTEGSYWTWVAHPMPPRSPIRSTRRDEFESRVEFWAAFQIGEAAWESGRIALMVNAGAAEPH